MLFGLLLIATTASSSAAATERPLSVSERNMIEASVREGLSDPDSATFKHNPYQISSSRYCGRVNAKNKFGGYVGYRLFAVKIVPAKTRAENISSLIAAPVLLKTNNQFDGSEMERMLFMVTEASCNSAGYDTGYTPVKVK